MAFRVHEGYLYCEQVRVLDVVESVGATPFYLYSLAQLRRNYQTYRSALGERGRVLYAVKANSNLALLKVLRAEGSGAVLVSGNELRLALEAGFSPSDLLLNGNGKTEADIAFAAESAVMVNIDSAFDLERIAAGARCHAEPLPVLLRVNPAVDPAVHQHVATGIRDSKFGVAAERVDEMVARIRAEGALDLVGLHCHLGSTIDRLDVFQDAARFMVKTARRLQTNGARLRLLNLGGGLGIDHRRGGETPSPMDLVRAVTDLVPAEFKLCIEPGRSVVGDAGILVSRVLGLKAGGRKRFIVVDASMTELVRPSLYDAYHHIDFVVPVAGKVETFDVVGPVCESGDYLARDRALAAPDAGTGIAVFDAGAYGYAMSSNYNMRTRPAEYVVDGERWTCIRRAETFDDLMEPLRDA